MNSFATGSMDAFAEHFFASLITFIIVFGIVLAIVAPTSALKFLKALGNLLGGLIYAPFVRLRASILNICEQAGKTEAELATSNQYMLRKFFAIVEGLVVIAGICILSGSLINGWNAVTPPAVKQKNQLEKQIKAANKELSSIEKKNMKMVKQWDKKSDGWRKDIKKDQAKLEKKHLDKAQVRVLLTSIRDEYADGQSAERNQSDAAQLISKVGIRDKKVVNDCEEYADLLFQLADLRKAKQPDWESSCMTLTQQLRHVGELESNYEIIKDYAKREPGQFFIHFFSGLLTFIGFMWISGLALEMWALGINIAGDLRAIRIAQVDLPVGDDHEGCTEDEPEPPTEEDSKE